MGDEVPYVLGGQNESMELSSNSRKRSLDLLSADSEMGASGDFTKVVKKKLKNSCDNTQTVRAKGKYRGKNS